MRGIDKVTISVHGHNDLGVTVANFLAAIEGGARQMECTINGIGERAGNALEELVMTCIRKGYYRCAIDQTIVMNPSQIYARIRFTSQAAWCPVLPAWWSRPTKTIVGANAFAHGERHSSRWVLKNKRTYRIMDAESIGLVDNIVLGKHSGRHAFRNHLSWDMIT